MRKLKNFDPNFITETFFSEIDPEEINMGQCFQWAYLAYNLFENVELWDLPHHAFVKYKGKYYDSECPNGEKDWRDLPASNWGRWYKTPRRQTPSAFKRDWFLQTKRFDTSWNELETLAKELINQGYH